jgi:hypothetical protein
MIQHLFKTRAAKLFAMLTFLLFMTMLTFQLINERFWLHDLEVMYSAAEAMLHKEPIYGTSFGLGTGFYKYSPFTLFFFVPYAVLPYKAACILHFFITLFSAIITIPLLEELIRKYLFSNRRKYYLTLFVTIVAILIHLVRDLHLGNINMILVFLLTLSLKFLLERKHLLFGAVVAIIILTKPYFVVFVLPLILHEKKKEIKSVLLFGCLFVFFSLVVFGFKTGFQLYLDWFDAMLNHSTYLYSNNTIFYLINRYTDFLIGHEYAFLLLGIIVVLTTIYFWFILRKFNDNTEQANLEKNRALVVHLAILIAFIPNVFITDTEHFLFSLPLISILILHFSKKKRWLWIPFLALILFLYGGNSTDMMGDYLNENYKSFGMLGIGNLLIIATTFIVYHNHRKEWKFENTDEA